MLKGGDCVTVAPLYHVMCTATRPLKGTSTRFPSYNETSYLDCFTIQIVTRIQCPVSSVTSYNETLYLDCFTTQIVTRIQCPVSSVIQR